MGIAEKMQWVGSVGALIAKKCNEGLEKGVHSDKFTMRWRN